MLRRFWKNFLKLEDKPLRRAFYESHSEQKMKTRGNDPEKQSEHLVSSKFRELEGQMETAHTMVQMTTNREYLKNYQLELSVKSTMPYNLRFLDPDRCSK